MVYYGLGAEEYDRVYTDKELMKRIFRYFGKHLNSMVLVISTIFISSILNGLVPLLSSYIINQVEIGMSNLRLVLLILGILVLNLFGFILNYVQQIFYARVVNRVILNMRSDVTANVLIQDLSFFDKYPTGKIVSRVNSDTVNFGEMANIFMNTIASLLTVVVLFIPMLVKSIRIAGLFALMIPFVTLFTMSFRKVARKKTLEGQQALASVNAFVQETVSGIQIAKTFRQEHKLYDQFTKVNKQSYKVNLSRALYMNIIFPSLNVIQGITLAFFVLLGGGYIIAGSINIGDFYYFLQSIWNLFFPIFMIAAFWPQFQTGLAAAERTFALIDSVPQVVQNDNKKLEEVSGGIKIENLEFHYKPEQKIYDKFNLEIKPGESVAIVGHTGAGKSSLANILLRFYDFQGGTITLDGENIRNIDLNDYRKVIGLIPQTPFLWGDTLEENVRYAQPQATREQIEWALEQAGGSEWVQDLPNGLNTNIRERGKLLSMGQRQLVVFARILLQDPRILILDEATASVDPFTETRIQEAMEILMQGRTSIIIAHRLRTVRHVDRIIVLDHGRIVEEGNHEDLMEMNGYYADLYNTYFKHQSYEFLEEIGTKC